VLQSHPLDRGTEAALTSMLEIATVVGISSLLAFSLLHRRGRPDHDVGMAAFEGFSLLFVFSLAAIDAYLCIDYLRQGEELTDAEFNGVVVMLVVAITVLVLFTAVARFSNLAGGIGRHLQSAVVTLFVAVTVAFAVPFLLTDPVEIVPASSLILLVGSCLAGFFFVLERRAMAGTGRAVRERFVSLCSDGYQSSRTRLLLGLPAPYSGDGVVEFVSWSKKGRKYLDHVGYRRLRDATRRCWSEFEAGEAVAARSERILMDVDLTLRPLSWPPKYQLVLNVYETGKQAPEAHAIGADEKGLFDVTEIALSC
jgi:hypothetical protein